MLQRINQSLFLFTGALKSQVQCHSRTRPPVKTFLAFSLLAVGLTAPSETWANCASGSISTSETVTCNPGTTAGLTITGTGQIAVVADSNALNISSFVMSGSVINAGILSTTDGGAGNAINVSGSTIGMGITNSGSIVAGTYGIYIDPTATVNGGIRNTGTGSGSVPAHGGGTYTITEGIHAGWEAISIDGVVNGGINNTGTIYGYVGGIALGDNTSNGTVTGGISNTGTITGYMPIYLIGANSSVVGGITNGSPSNSTAALIAQGAGSAIGNSGSIDAISNYGAMHGGLLDGPGILNNTGGSMGSIVNYNSGIISSSSAGVSGYGISNAATSNISSITNYGTITGNSVTAIDILNAGTIGVLNNRQSSLRYQGALPNNYNVIINSTSVYGKLSGSSLTGTTTFGITPTSTLVGNTYTAVLSGFAAANLANQVGGKVTGSLSGLNWTLSPEGGSPTIWDLIVTDPTPTPTPAPTPATTPTSTSEPTPTPAPAPAPQPTNMTQGGTSSLASIGVTTNPVFSGGTLALTSGANTSQPFTVTSAGGTITTPSGSSATMTGGLTGSGPMTFNGGGTLVFSGTSTYTGGTTVSDNTTLSIAGSSPLGTGAIFIASGSSLSGSGTIGAPVTVAGYLHPGNSPGYLALTQQLTINAGGTFQQDIAGRAQASATSPVGATGYYSFLQVAGAGVTINPGATLTPRLQNLFSASESGYGSAPYMPVVGDKFRILTADGGITGKFTTLTQPAGLDPATQFISFYNYNNSNSLDLAVIPASFNTAVASSSGNKNAQSVASALDRMVVANQATTSTAAQEALLYTASGQSLASLPSFTQGMAGEIYGATLAVVPQTSQRIQQAVISRLGDTMSAPVMAGAMAAMTNTAISASNPGGQPTASMSSNPNVNPYASGSGGMSMSNGAAWGEVAYQYGNRASDSNSGGWSSNLVQAVVGVDLYSDGATKAGGGVALSNTNVSASLGSGTVQQGSLFLYGKLPVQQFVVDAMASYGFNSTNNARNDATGLTSGLQAKNVQGNDALVSLGLNLPIDLAESRVIPYVRATWQQVNQNGFNEGSAASALTVNSFNGNGVRGLLGVAAGSKAVDPIKEQTTYRVNVGLGMDSTNVLNPQLNASLAGMTTTINTPGAGAAFVQAGMYGTVKFADNAFAYAGVSAEARGGQVLAGGNIGVRLQF